MTPPFPSFLMATEMIPPVLYAIFLVFGGTKKRAKGQACHPNLLTSCYL